MRIEFANSDRQPLLWEGTRLRIGSAEGNDVVVPQSGVAAHHLELHRDARGVVMQVQPGAGRVYVNARPVRERALLRAGDSLGLGDCRLRLCGDSAATRVNGGNASSADAGLATLRIVAGPLCGRVVALRERLDLGPRGQLPLSLPGLHEGTLAFLRDADGWRVDAGSLPERFIPGINGNPLRGARLHHGDQIVLGAHHFLFEAWPSTAPMPERADTDLDEPELPEDSAGPRGEVWWLIVTAAVIGLVLALLLFVRF